MIVGVVQQHVAGGAWQPVEEFEIQAARPYAGHCRQQLRHDDGRVQQADQRRATLGCVRGAGSLRVQRNIQQHAGGFAVVLHQRDRRGDGRLAAVDGTLCCGTAVGFRADVETLGAGVVRRRLDELDDVQIVVVLVRQLAKGEFRCFVGPFGGHEGVHIPAHDALNEAKAPHPREVLHQVARLNVGPKLRALHAFAGSEQAPGAVQSVDRAAKAHDDLAGKVLDAALELGLGIQVDLILPPPCAASSNA
ncbi:MAG: hypothetical protein V5B38_04690 [Candidatus Accumulibacter propinquus]